MLTHPTIDQLRALRLDGMGGRLYRVANTGSREGPWPAEWLALMLDREAAHRGTQRFKSRLAMRSCAHGRAQGPSRDPVFATR